ncbi:WD40-repeat-containing domain protein [Sparassis latifolia]
MVTVRDAQGGVQLAPHEAHKMAVCALGVSPDGLMLLSAGDEVVLLWKLSTTVRLWDVEKGETTHLLGGHTSIINCIVFSADGQRVATAAGDYTAGVWDVASGAQLSLLQGYVGILYTVAFSPDALRVVTGAEGTVRVWRAETGEALVTLREHKKIVYHAMFSEDGQQVLSVGAEGRVKVCDSYSGEVLRSIDATANAKDRLTIAAISRDGKLACTAARDNVVRVWNLDTGAAVAAFEDHKDSVQELIFSPDATRVISRSDDETMRIWNL